MSENKERKFKWLILLSPLGRALTNRGFITLSATKERVDEILRSLSLSLSIEEVEIIVKNQLWTQAVAFDNVQELKTYMDRNGYSRMNLIDQIMSKNGQMEASDD